MRFLLSIIVAFGLTSTPGFGQTVPVDLELSFVVDASGSIDENEKLLRRQGYFEALTHPRIQRAIISGILVRIGSHLSSFPPMAANDLAFSGRPSMAVSQLRRSDENYWFWTTIHVLAAMPPPMPLPSRHN